MALRLRQLVLIVVCCLTKGMVLAQTAVPIPELTGPQTATSGGEFVLDGADYGGVPVWGRVNPDYGRDPTISVAVDLVVLQRDTPAAQPIIFDGAFVTPLLDASDLDLDTRAGARINLTFLDESGWDFMFDMLFHGDFEAQPTVDSSGGVTLPFYGGIALAPIDTAFYRSDFDTGELNVRRRFGPNVGLLAGVRYLELNERLDFALQGSPNEGYFSQTDNRLFGVQIGGEAVVPANAYLRLFACGKFGIFNNSYEVTAQATSTSSTPLRLRSGDDMEAYVGDLNFGFEVQTVPSCTLRFGYQIFWIENVALSADQINQYDIFTGAGSVSKGSPIYQGGFGGLVFTF
jgi:hypothetical protein